MAQGGVRAEPQPPMGNVRLDRYPTLTGNGHFSQTWQWFYIQWRGTYKSHTGEVERGPCRSWATLLTPVVVEIAGGAFQAACRHSTGSHSTLGWSLKKVLHAYDLWPWVLNPEAWETWDLKSETRYIPAGSCTFVSNSFSRMSLLDPGALLPDFISCCWREGPQRAWNILTWLQTIKTWSLSHLGRSTPLAKFRAQSSSPKQQAAGHSTLFEYLSDPLWEKKSTGDSTSSQAFFYFISKTTRWTQLSTRQACFHDPACQLLFTSFAFLEKFHGHSTNHGQNNYLETSVFSYRVIWNF